MTEQRAFLLRTAAIWLLLELLAATQVPGPNGTPVAWLWLRAATRPVAWSAERAGEVVSDLAFGVRDTRRLLAENQRLRHQLQDAQSRNLLLTEDLAALHQTADMVGGVDGFEVTSVAARCVYRSLPLGWLEVRIATPAVIQADTPVVSSNGLVGRVVRSTRRSCWIETLTHPAAAVAVTTQNGKIEGLVTGDGTRDVALAYVSRSAALLRGELLVTSGADGIYPPGIPVATVSRIRESDDAFLEVLATPAVDLGRVRVVLLLPGWNPERPRSP